MKNQPLVSVIINCHNGEKYLSQSINSVYSQTYQNWEIIFLDNNSTDNTANIAKSFNYKLKYFKSKEYLKLYDARNKALDLCNGDIICFLDSDDIWIKNKIELQLKFYCKEYPIIYGAYQIIDFKNKKGKTFTINRLSGFITYLLIYKNIISIGCIMINANLVKNYKFDPYFEILGDYELWLRLSLKYKFKNAQAILQYYRIHSNNLTKRKQDLLNKERRYLYTKLFREFNIKYYPHIIYMALRYEIKGFLVFIKNLIY